MDTIPKQLGIERQKRYVAEQSTAGDDSLIVGAAFVRGIRDLGYQNSAKAIDELVDNAVQANAANVHIVFETNGKGGKKGEVLSYAVIDDGYGMIPSMLAYAAKWGGTDRENDRTGLGRYGYGLPSSCVSQGRRFRIFSRVDGGALYGVTVDLDDLRPGEGGRIPAPKAHEVALPLHLEEYVNKRLDGLAHGVVVLVDKLDRLTWTSPDGLRKSLLEHQGLVYRNYLEDRTFLVDGTPVEPIDPLFLTSGARYHNLPGDQERAVRIDLEPITMRTFAGDPVIVRLRASYLPPRFGFLDKAVTYTTPPNKRMAIMGEHEGLIVMRMGRQMDVITRHPWNLSGRTSAWRPEDRYWQIEVDFPADLDEKFSVTTSKQSVRLHDSIWDALEKAGIRRSIADLKKRHDEDIAKIKSGEGKDKDKKRPSEQAMEEAAEFKGARPTADQSAATERNAAAVSSQAGRAAEQTGLPFDEVKAQLEEDIARHPFRVFEETATGAPFYRPEGRWASSSALAEHDAPFFTELYAGPKSTPEIRAALEVLLFVLAGEETLAMDKRLEFYERERTKWSDELRTTLRQLAKIMPDSRAATEASGA